MFEPDKKAENVEDFTFRAVGVKSTRYRVFIAGLSGGFTVVTLR